MCADSCEPDTAPILTFLDVAYPKRCLRPSDPALRLLDLLIEDFEDEWLTKYMFHYRLSKDEAARLAGAYLPFSMNMQAKPDDGSAASAAFTKRQVAHLAMVESSEHFCAR